MVRVSAIEVTEVERPGGVYESLSNYLAGVRADAGRSTERQVSEAARLYRAARTVSLAPLKLVSTHMGVSGSTATRLVSRARDAGLVDDLTVRETYVRKRGARII